MKILEPKFFFSDFDENWLQSNFKEKNARITFNFESCISFMPLWGQYGPNQHNWPCKFMLPNVNLDIPREIKKLFYFEFHQCSIILNLLI